MAFLVGDQRSPGIYNAWGLFRKTKRNQRGYEFVAIEGTGEDAWTTASILSQRDNTKPRSTHPSYFVKPVLVLDPMELAKYVKVTAE